MRVNTLLLGFLAGSLVLSLIGVASSGVTDQMDSADFTYRYEFNPPENERPDQSDMEPLGEPGHGTPDFSWFNNASPAGTASVAGGILTMETTVSLNGNWFYCTKANEAWDVLAPTLASGYTIEVRAKIGTDLNYPLTVVASADGTVSNAYLNIAKDGQRWYNGPALGNTTNSDVFHTFRIAQAPSTTTPTYSVWRDGRLLNGTLGSSYDSSRDVLYFGDIGSAWGGKAEIDHFRFTKGAYAPEIGSHPDLYAWYKADAGVEDTAGNRPDDGENVGLWENQAPSGSARDLDQRPNAPNYNQSATLYGKPAVHFNANEFIYAFPTNWGTLAQPDTIFMVLRTETDNGGTPLYATASSGIQMLISGSESSPTGKWVLGTDANIVGGLNEDFLLSADVDINQFQIHTLVFDGANTEHYIDGQLVASGPLTNKSLAGLLLGAHKEEFYGNWTGDIAEVLVYSDVLADPDRQAIEGYLYQKYFTPEPSAAVLLVLGIVLLCFKRRR